ncbi:MAG: ATP-binding protein [Bacillota bacterium]
MRTGMQGKIVLVYSLLILFAMQLGGVYLVKSLENYYLRNFTASQNSQAELLGNFLRRYLLEEEQQPEQITGLIANFWEGSPVTEIMVLDRHGRLLGGPEQRSFSLMGGRVIQDDILLALTGNRVETFRADPQTGGRHHYLALPIKDGAAVVGVVFLRSSLEHIYVTLREIKFMLLSGWLVVLAIAIVIGFLLTRTITQPIREVTSRAAALASGDFSQQITVRSEDEIGELGRMFNHLATRLQETLQEISAEKNKVETILNYMTDGILAFNREGKAIHLNPAAQELLQQTRSPYQPGLSAEAILGSLFSPAELRQLLFCTTPAIREIHLVNPQERTLQVCFVPFVGKEEQQGMLVVFHDVTRERAYTRMQQEFVANVSHELRTPLTTIKNYLETLLNGAQEKPAVRARFLEVLDKETDRMVKMVRDLLILSRLDSPDQALVKEKLEISALINEVLEQVALEGSSRDICLRTVLPRQKLFASLERNMIVQVLLILLDNALKYTAAGGEVVVSAGLKEKGYIFITVKDTGIGIPADELERVFERFYRVDKARSRDSGGTGLGLSIARQIVESHGGKISLRSIPGEGTEATVCLPQDEKEGKGKADRYAGIGREKSDRAP